MKFLLCLPFIFFFFKTNRKAKNNLYSDRFDFLDIECLQLKSGA